MDKLLLPITNGKLQPINKSDWRDYAWIQVGPTEFIRGMKYTSPPNDGYEYLDVTLYGDKEQKWARAMEVIKEETT